MKTIAASAVGLLLITGLTGGNLHSRTEAVSADAVTFAREIADLIAIPFEASCHDCVTCSEDPVRHETTPDTTAKWEVFSQAHQAIHGCSGSYSLHDCGSAHTQTCGQPEFQGGGTVALHELLNEMLEAAPEKLAAMIEAYPSVLVLNRERSALQVYGCTGELIAHLRSRRVETGRNLVVTFNCSSIVNEVTLAWSARMVARVKQRV